jgi:hypothetical protein
MAAGLPVVVSDWDGYRDTVRHGLDGFRIPTLMPDAGFGVDLARRHALGVDNYDMYCGHTSMLVAVDVDAAANSLERLVRDPILRRRMGESGQARAREIFDWRHIIGRYEALWSELAILRNAAPAAARRPYQRPARLDPYQAFAGYPTRRLSGTTLLELAGNGDVQALLDMVSRYRVLAMVRFAEAVLPNEGEVALILANAANGPRQAAQLVADLPQNRRNFALRSLTWLTKIGALKVCE